MPQSGRPVGHRPCGPSSRSRSPHLRRRRRCRATLGAAGARLGGIRTLLAVPMLKEDELIGAIVIYRQEVRPFTDKQIELVRTSPPRPSSPSRTRGCSTSCAKSLQQQTATADVLKVISRSTFDLQTVLEHAGRVGRHLCEADIGGIWLPTETGSIVIAMRDVRRHSREHEAFQSAAHPVSTGRYGNWADAASKARSSISRMSTPIRIQYLAGPEARRLSGPCSASRCCAKGRADRRRCRATAKSVRPFTDKQIELVTTFADQAVIAIENVAAVRRGAGAHARADRVAGAADRDLRGAQVISSSPGELEPVFETMLANGSTPVRGEVRHLCLHDGDGLPIARRMIGAPPRIRGIRRQRNPIRRRTADAVARARLDQAGGSYRRRHAEPNTPNAPSILRAANWRCAYPAGGADAQGATS